MIHTFASAAFALLLIPPLVILITYIVFIYVKIRMLIQVMIVLAGVELTVFYIRINKLYKYIEIRLFLLGLFYSVNQNNRHMNEFECIKLC